MLIVIPFIAFITVSIALFARYSHCDWRLAVLRSATLLAVYFVLANELLSIFSLISTFWLAVVWTMPILVAGIVGGRSIREQIFRRGSPRIWPESWHMRVILVSMLVILILTAAVAWLAPPNTWDSLNTHMSRVAEWAQNHSLQPFATGIEKQNYYPPFPGIAILQSYLLTQGDHWANFAQWGAMVLSLIGVSFIAKQIGARGIGQLFASVFAASLPMGIAQATSTMTDYIVALWIVVVTVECLRLSKRQVWSESALFLSMAAALAINTKPTSFAYLLPLAIYATWLLLKYAGWNRALLAALLCLAVTVLINAGYLGRNLELYGEPFGPQSRIDVHSNEVLNWRVLVSNTLRNASLHAWSPIPQFNSLVYAGMLKIHQWIDLELTDSRTSVHDSFAVRRPSTDEKNAGNFYHALMILVLVVILMITKKKEVRQARLFAAIVISTFLIFSLLFKFSIFGSRYHVAFFILFAPIAGLVISEYLNDSLQTVMALALVISSWSWLVGIDSRPLWPKEPGGDSLLTSPRAKMYFPGLPSYQKGFMTVSEIILEHDCRAVGIALGGAATEYPIWVYLGAPDDDLHIEWIVGGTPSARFSNKQIQLCAAICDATCPTDWVELRGMPVLNNVSGLRLYMDSP